MRYFWAGIVFVVIGFAFILYWVANIDDMVVNQLFMYFDWMFFAIGLTMMTVGIRNS